jgi:hypothetical protein
MKLSTVWTGNKPAKKRMRPARKPKIRWQLLGLPEPTGDDRPTPMEEIRREVSSLASRGFGQGTRSRAVTPDKKATGQTLPGGKKLARRRGATE